MLQLIISSFGCPTTPAYDPNDFITDLKPWLSPGDYAAIMFEVFNIAGDYKDVMNLEELDIYGSKRMGMVQLDRLIQRVDYAGTINTSTGYGSLAAYSYTENYTMPNMTDPYIEFPRTLGQKRYELTNHLGNVLAVISDKKIIINISGTNYYDAEVITAQDYYAFGAPMPGRSYQVNGVGGYRYGFNGKEKDDEVKGSGDQYDYGMRIYDARLGRFMSTCAWLKGFRPFWYTKPD